jgi:DNA-3-methyladenine glycosylase II
MVHAGDVVCLAIDIENQDRTTPTMTTALSCCIALPVGFRQNDVLAFHRRDVQQIAEQIEGNVLRKGLVWEGHPACLSFRFDHGSAQVELAIDDATTDDDQVRIERMARTKQMARRMLGLTQRIEEFEQAYRSHPLIGEMVTRNSGLRVPLAPTPFEALCWAVTGQQISVSAAVSIRRKVIQAAGMKHSGGLWCFPDSRTFAKMSEQTLRQTGLSLTKAKTLIALSERVENRLLPLDDWVDAPPEEEIRAQLLAIRGIGPWTVNYALLRGFGWLDGSLHGDVAVRRNLQVLLGKPDKLREDEAKQWLAQFSPWRALVAAHLWAMQKTEGY